VRDVASLFDREPSEVVGSVEPGADSRTEFSDCFNPVQPNSTVGGRIQISVWPC
jgi:hypothetical protein